jgi:hypothetical protein
MAAIAYPRPAEEQLPAPRHLRVVPPPVRRPSRRMYWRRRVVVLLAVVLVVLAARAALGVLGGGPLTTSGAPAGRGPAAVYVVQPGDTFWTIANRLHPGGDVRAFVDRLAAAHGAGPLQPGERLALP